MNHKYIIVRVGVQGYRVGRVIAKDAYLYCVLKDNGSWFSLVYSNIKDARKAYDNLLEKSKEFLSYDH